MDSIQGLQANNLSRKNEILSNVVEYNFIIDSLSQQIDLISFNYQQEIDYLSSPIPIDLLLVGWNMIGDTNLQRASGCSSYSSRDLLALYDLVKDNSAQVYWPEFGYNGIGNLTVPRLSNKVGEEYPGFTYLDTEGQRIELTPTVQWVIDMEVEMHPNDIRTLVRVVIMLGQEVNPEMELKEVYYYTYTMMRQ